MDSNTLSLKETLQYEMSVDFDASHVIKNNERCIVVIPIYKTFNELSEYEQKSIYQAISILGKKYVLCLLCSTEFDVTSYTSIFNFSVLRTYSGLFFSLTAYNRLCQHKNFYKSLLDKGYEYMLIYQPDAWIFEDRLEYFMNLGYGYIGCLHYANTHNEPIYENLINGNGGLSLRKLSLFYDVTSADGFFNEIFRLDNDEVLSLPEDIFFSMAKFDEIKVAPKEISLEFGWQQDFNGCYKALGHLPMGAHGMKVHDWEIWKPYIDDSYGSQLTLGEIHFDKIHKIATKEHPLIVTMTSWKKRLSTLPIAINAIKNQTLQPDKIILWLSSDELSKDDVPQELYSNPLLEIKWVDKNIMCFKRYLTIYQCPEAFTFIMDDDLIYPNHYLEDLYNESIKHNNNGAVCYCSGFCNLYGEPWGSIYGGVSTFTWIGGGVTLYPPNVFPLEAFNYYWDIMKDEPLQSDECLLMPFIIHNNIPIYSLHDGDSLFTDFHFINGTQGDALCDKFAGKEDIFKDNGKNRLLRRIVKQLPSKYYNSYKVAFPNFGESYAPPLVSIIIPCYNCEKYVSEAIASVKAQTYDNWECIIINDGSTDNSEKIILNAIKNDKRFIYIRQENCGIASARNTAARLTKGKYLLPFDSDDMLMNCFIQDAVEIMEKDWSISLLIPNAISFGHDGVQPKLSWYINYAEELKFNSIFNTSMMKKEEFDSIGGYNEKIKYYEDWDLWIRLLYGNKKVYNYPKVGYLYRVSAMSFTNAVSSPNRTIALHELISNNQAIYDEYNLGMV